jgi:pilus assembly protein CpaE
MQTNPTLLFVENIPRGLKKIRKSLESIENIDIIDKDVNSGQIALQTIREFMPDVVLLERKLPDMDGVKLTEIIRREFIGVQVVLLSKDTRAEVVRKAMRSGACEFLSHNTTFEELESAIKWAAELADEEKVKTLKQSGQDVSVPVTEITRRREGRIITVYSPKGGVGVSTVAVNLAMALREGDIKVALIDASFQWGDVSILCNEVGRHSMDELLPWVYQLDTQLVEDSMLYHDASGVHIMAAPSTPEESEKVTAIPLTHILDFMRRMYDYIILNTSSQVNDSTLATLDVGDVTLLVTVQEVVAIGLSQSFLRLTDKLAIDRERIFLLVNEYDKNLDISTEMISERLQKNVDITIPLDSSTAVKAANLGIPFVLGDKNKPITKSIYALAELVTGRIEEISTLIEQRVQLHSITRTQV